MSKSVLILGAGVVGLSSALYAARRGFNVTVVDRRPASRDGASFGNAGMIVPSHFIPLAAPGMVRLGLKWMWDPRSPFYIKPRFSWDLLSWGVRFWKASTRKRVDAAAPLLRDLHLASRALYEELADAADNDFGLERRGLLMLCDTAEGLSEESHAADRANQLGVPAEVLDAAGIAAIEPHIRTSALGGVFYPRDCHLSPERLIAGLESRLRAAGATLHFDTDIAAIDTHDGRLRAARTADGRALEADEFVLAGGIWSTTLARSLGLKLPMQAGKGYSLSLSQPRQCPNTCSILTEARVAVTPMNGGLRFGGTMEMAGLDESVTAARVEGIINAAARYYPEFTPADFAGIKPWAGLRPCPPDGLPYLGRTKRYANLTLATGHAMMGISLAPVSGKIVADLLAGESPALASPLMSPDRY